jgi:ADP-heptose:LPS heptosyltransferase
VDDVFVIDRARGAGAFWAVCRAIRRSRFQTAFIFDGQTRSIAAACLAGLKTRLGASCLYPLGACRALYTGDLSRPEPRPLNSRTESPETEARLASQSLRGQRLIAAALGLAPKPRLRPLPPPIKPENARLDADLLNGLSGAGPGIGLALQGLQPEKTWPLASFALLCRKLYAHCQARLFVVGGPSESALAASLARSAGVPVADFCGRTGLLDLLALAGAADLFITVDTGVSHVVALTETPLISIFIWTSPALWPPQTPHARIMCYDWPLYRFGLDPGDGPWRTAPFITADMVFEEALGLLEIY